MNSNFFVICGPSGVGKGTLVKRLLADIPNVALSISCTTRKPREGETDGVSYYFLSKDEFEKRIKENLFLEWALVHGNYYGTPRDYVENNVKDGKIILLEIDVQGALAVKQQKPDTILLFIAPPSVDELRRRLDNRGTDDEATKQTRIKNAMEELSQQDKFDVVLVNDDLEICYSKLKNLITGRQDK